MGVPLFAEDGVKYVQNHIASMYPLLPTMQQVNRIVIRQAGSHMEGFVVSIAIASKSGSPMIPIPTAHLVPNKGIEGDRFSTPHGRDSNRDDTCDVTFVEQEPVVSESFSGHTARRNIVVRDCSLQEFVGRTFRVGDVFLQGLPSHEVCSSGDVVQITSCMTHASTSLRARILTEGTITTGDRIQCL